MPNTLILGIGNTLLTDEGIGIHVLNALKQDPDFKHPVEFLDGGTLSFTLASPIENCQQFIVIDASEINRPAGSVAVYENEAMDHFVSTGNKKSVHEVGLVDVLSIAMLNDRLPHRRALIGIQPQCFDWGDHPSDEVQQAIPEACNQIKILMESWTS